MVAFTGMVSNVLDKLEKEVDNLQRLDFVMEFEFDLVAFADNFD